MHFRHKQGHQRRGATTGSNIMIQSTKFTVNEVEHQKTTNAKNSNLANWSSEVKKKNFFITTGRKPRLENFQA